MRMKPVFKKAVACVCVLSIVISSLFIIPAVPVDAASFDGYTPITLSDFGIENDDYVYNTQTGISFAKSLTSKEDLYDKVLTFYATFGGAGDNIYYGMEGVDDWTALQITVPKTDTGKLYIHNGDGSDAGWTNVATFSPSEVGVTSMIGTKLKIAIAADKGDFNNNGTENDLKIITSVNDCAAKELIFEGGASNFADKFGVYATQSGKISLESIQSDAVETSPEGLKVIGWEDFGITKTSAYTMEDVPANGVIANTASSSIASLVGTSFRGKLALKRQSDSTYFISYGDFGLNSLGIRITPQSDGTLLFQGMDVTVGWPYITLATINPETVELTSFTDGTEFELGIDIWEVEDPNDSIKDLKINIFINGEQCTKRTVVWENALHNNTSAGTKFIGTNMNFFAIKKAQDEVKVILPDPETSPNDLVPITWTDFGLLEKEEYTVEDVPEAYEAFGVIPLRWNSDKAINPLIGTSFRGKLSLKLGSDNSNYFISYGDNGVNSFGIRITPQKNGKLLMQAMDMQVGWPYITLATLNPTKVGLTSFTDGTVFELGIDMWEVEDAEDGINDVKINVFINGTQYNTAAYVWENAVYNDSISVAKFLGNNINLNLIKEKDEVVIYGEKPDYGTPIKPDASLKEISFSSFGVADGTYDYNKNDLSVKGGYYDPERGKSLNGTLFNGYVNFDSEWGIQLRLGGKTSAWEGIIIVSNGDGKLLLVDSKNNTWCVFTPHLAGVQLTDNLMNLKMSIVYVDSDKDGKKDDVQVGVWFNDVLYKNQYIYMTDYADSLGSMLGIYSPKTGVDMVVKSVKVDNSVNFALFGFDADHDNYIKSTGKMREVYIKAIGSGKNVNISSDSSEKTSSVTSPQTGDYNKIGLYVMLMMASACAVVLHQIKGKNK